MWKKSKFTFLPYLIETKYTNFPCFFSGVCLGIVVVRQGAGVTAIGSTISAAMHRERTVRMMILLGLFVFASLHVTFSGAVCFAHIHNYGQGDVSCGDHRATDCSKCPCDPQGLSRGEFWCNGDCHWNRTINECKETGKKTKQRSYLTQVM